MRVLALLLLASSASAFPVRVFYKPNGGVIVLSAVMCGKDESPQACLERVGAKDCPRTEAKECLPYDDIDSSQLPDRSTRNKWRGNKATKLRVDNTVVTQSEKMANAEADLEAELEKPSPDPVKVIKLQRKLEKAKKERDAQ